MITVDAALDIETDSGCRRVRLSSYLDSAAAESAETSTLAWIKALRSMRVDGSTFRDRFTVRGDSLWWFAEIYLHRSRVVASVFQTLFALEALIATESPRAVRFRDGDRIAARVSALVAARHAIPFRGPRQSVAVWATRVGHRLRASIDALMAWMRRRRPIRSTPLPDSAIAVFVYTAFWQSEPADETYLGPVLKELQERVSPDRLCLVGIGPRVKFKQRRWKDRLAELLDPTARDLSVTPVELYWPSCSKPAGPIVWRARRATRDALLSSDELRRAAVIRGFDVWPILADEWRALAGVQFPWAARAMDLAAGALDALRPSVVFTYAEAGGWGRALTLEARRRGIPVVGAQHGFIHRHWIQYLHEPDEMCPAGANSADRGFPLPDVTLVYDQFTVQHLVENGRFPRAALAATGSPRLDAFVEVARELKGDDIERIRERAGARPGQHLVVLASKYTKEFERAFAALVSAVQEMPDVLLTMKCHPADAREPYERLADGVPNVTVTDATAGLVALTAAARLLVTVNSTAAIEAVAIDVPVLALLLPNYLSPFVEAGAMAGTQTLAEIAPTMRALIDDEASRQALAEGRRAFFDRYEIRADGGAARRAADIVLDCGRCSNSLPTSTDPGSPTTLYSSPGQTHGTGDRAGHGP